MEMNNYSDRSDAITDNIHKHTFMISISFSTSFRVRVSEWVGFDEERYYYDQH